MSSTVLDREFEYYQKNKPDFLSKYEGKYIVIKGEKVLGVYDDRVKAVDETLEEHELGTFLVKQVVKNDVAMFHSRVRIKSCA